MTHEMFMPLRVAIVGVGIVMAIGVWQPIRHMVRGSKKRPRISRITLIFKGTAIRGVFPAPQKE